MKADRVTMDHVEDLVGLFGYDFGMMIPNVDQVIDWLRVRHNIIIYHKMAPYVDPKTPKIIYCFAVKWCNLRDGWNGRELIGQSEYCHDIYEAKKQAITIALNWLKEKRKKK